MSPERLRLIAILAAVAAVFLSYELLVSFHDWNRMQTCATSGGRNCGTYQR
jgi:hypothetical protein